MATYLQFLFGLVLCVSLSSAQNDGDPTPPSTITPLPPTPPTTPSTTTLGGPLPPSSTPGSTLRICYACGYLTDVHQCRHLKRCCQDQECLYAKTDKGRYYLSCVPKPACGIPAVDGVVNFLGQKFLQFQCCDTDKCNKSPAVSIENGFGK